MINTIGFIPNYSEITTLDEFVPNEDVKKKLDYLQIPICPKGQEDSTEKTAEEEWPAIKNTDKILFCSLNSENMSSIAFYGYDDAEMYFHHDLIVFSTIIDTCFINDTLVGVATFEPDIMIYDFKVNFPTLPQHLLSGHTGPVTGIKNKYEKLISCSDDKTIIEWDINEMRLRSQKSYDISIEKFDFEGNSLVFGAQSYLNINNESISLENELEQLKIKDNFVYVSDYAGNMLIYDVRTPNKAIITQKLGDSAIVDFCLAKDWIATTSQDSSIGLWKMEGSALFRQSDITSNPPVLALGFNENDDFDEVFAGNEDDEIFPIKLEENTQFKY